MWSNVIMIILSVIVAPIVHLTYKITINVMMFATMQIVIGIMRTAFAIEAVTLNIL